MCYKMNVYDFDGTIYNGDSTLDFYFFCLKREPRLIRFLPVQIAACVKYMFKKCTKTEWKEQFYIFLQGLQDVGQLIIEFWDNNEKKMYDWYLVQKKESDVIISASPDFLLSEVCKRLNITHLIASQVDPESGKYNGLNCYGEEKVKRFYAEFLKDTKFDFYSDSYSDKPMACMAQKAFIIKDGQVQVWEKDNIIKK